MTTSYAYTSSVSFTITHAKHIAAKVATDLKRIQRFYGAPSDASIANYEAELIALLKDGYLGTVTYGFQRHDKWVEPTVSYTAMDLIGGSTADDDPGRIRAGANVAGAVFRSYLTYSTAWNALPFQQRDQFSKSLPFQRNGALEPATDGFMIADKAYSAGSRGVQRAVVRSW